MPSCSFSAGLSGFSVMAPSKVESVRLNLIDQRRPRYAELARGAGAVSRVVAQRPLDLRPLHVRQALRLMAALGRRAPPAQVGRQVLGADLRLAPRQDHRPLQNVA